MDRELVEGRLWSIFENINSWLKYAEGKNAYILAFIGAEITLLNFLNVQYDFWLGASFVFLGLCFFICLISFFPKTAIPGWLYYFVKSKQLPSDFDNLLFYGDIAKYSIKGYIKKLSEWFNYKIEDDKYLENLCGQILINAGIASEKFKIFKTSFWSLLIGQVFVIISFLVQ